MIRLKEGASINGLQAVMVQVLAILCSHFDEIVVTSGTDVAPGRIKDSLHAVGLAVDIRWKPEFADPARWPWLGQGIEVVHYDGSHVHIEYDPPKTRNCP